MDPCQQLEHSVAIFRDHDNFIPIFSSYYSFFLACAEEVGLRFRLPESELVLAPSAEVVWSRNRDESRLIADGAGVRFVEIDGPSVRSLDDYVYERTTSRLLEGFFSPKGVSNPEGVLP